jgi:hypothetical protein
MRNSAASRRSFDLADIRGKANSATHGASIAGRGRRPKGPTLALHSLCRTFREQGRTRRDRRPRCSSPSPRTRDENAEPNQYPVLQPIILGFGIIRCEGRVEQSGERMASHFGSFRELLTRNEIIFKTVAASALSLMALIVSAGQLFTAREQIAVASLQERIAEIQLLPQFEIAIHQRRNNETGKFDDNYLEVINTGSPVHEFTAEVATFLRVSGFNTHIGNNAVSVIPSRIATTKFEIPFGGYFPMQEVSPAGKGQLVTSSGYHNNAAMIALENSVREAADNAKWNVLNLDTLVYLKLTYQDMLDRLHEDYYTVPNVGGGLRMKDADGKTIFAKWGQPGRADLSHLTGEKLVSEADKHIESDTRTGPTR